MRIFTINIQRFSSRKSIWASTCDSLQKMSKDYFKISLEKVNLYWYHTLIYEQAITKPYIVTHPKILIFERIPHQVSSTAIIIFVHIWNHYFNSEWQTLNWFRADLGTRAKVLGAPPMEHGSAKLQHYKHWTKLQLFKNLSHQQKVKPSVYGSFVSSFSTTSIFGSLPGLVVVYSPPLYLMNDGIIDCAFTGG